MEIHSLIVLEVRRLHSRCQPAEFLLGTLGQNLLLGGGPRTISLLFPPLLSHCVSPVLPFGLSQISCCLPPSRILVTGFSYLDNPSKFNLKILNTWAKKPFPNKVTCTGSRDLMWTHHFCRGREGEAASLNCHTE